MTIAIQVLLSILQTFAIMGLGILALRWKLLKEDALPGLSRFDLDVLTPILTFLTIVNSFDRSQANLLWIMPVVAILVMVIGFIAGIPFRYCLKNDTHERRGTLHHLCTISNFLYLPLIVIQNIWGKHEVSLLLIANVGNMIGLWTLGILTFHKRQPITQTIKTVFGVNFWAVIVGVVFVLAGWSLHPGVTRPLQMVADMTVPLMLLLTGASIWLRRSAITSGWRDAFLVVLLRLIVVPAIVICVIRLLPIPADALKVTQVIAIMPAAAASILIAGQYGGDDGFAGQAIILTTIAALGTVPLWLLLLA